MTRTNQRAAGLAMLGILWTACSEAEATGDALARELRDAGKTLNNWTEMNLEEFQQATERTLEATDRRIEELRVKVANSNAADQARTTLHELETKRKQLATKLSEMRETATDKLGEAKQSVVDGVSELNDRLSSAWDALAHG